MRYFKINSEGLHQGEWGGFPTDWLEVDEVGNIEREINEYPNGNTLTYDKTHQQDEYGVLTTDNIEPDDNFWKLLEITKDEFEREWNTISPINRIN